MQMYVNYYTRELMNPGDNPPVGIVLCAEKNDAVVRYTLPEDEKQVFAALRAKCPAIIQWAITDEVLDAVIEHAFDAMTAALSTKKA